MNALVTHAPSVESYAFALEFRNVFGVKRFVVLAPDIWRAMSHAEKLLAETSTNEYPYRLVNAKEIDGAVLDAANVRANE